MTPPRRPKRTVADLFPGVVAAWHPTKNEFRPEQLFPKSDRFVWLRCTAAPDHEWHICVAHATRVDGRCPFCAGKRPSSTSSLAARFPDLAKEWHPALNGRITPHDVAPGSGFYAAWRCPQHPRAHVWRTAVANRTARRSGCPYCQKEIGSPMERLDRRRPAVAAQWHPTKNGELTPASVTVRSVRAVWWRCPEGHEWLGSIVRRCRAGLECPLCTHRVVSAEFNLATTHPALAAEWHPTKNGELRADGVLPGCHRRVWWKCAKGEDHVWVAAVEGRVSRRNGCPFCSGRRAAKDRSLAALRPDLAAEWHPTKNGELRPTDVRPGSGRRVWWKCPKGPDHEWRSRPFERARATGCVFCIGRRASVTNSLEALHPSLAREWHRGRNGRLRPRDVPAGSGRLVHWKCPRGPDHQWKARVEVRVRFPRCPFCVGRRVSITNSLARLAPRVAAEWHPTRNGALTPRQVHAGSHEYAWWRCALGHAWRATIHHRTTRGQNCPRCWELGRPTRAAWA